MDIVISGLAARTNEVMQSCDDEELRSGNASSNNTTPTRTPRRMKSMFSLAGSIFRSHLSNDEPDHPEMQQDLQLVKDSWNPFASLRGLKESKRKSTNIATTRGKCSSPQKDDTLMCDEFGKRKTMRRKSLQDLLGTMGTKLSRGRRQVTEEVTHPPYEERGEEGKCQIIVSPSALPTSSLRLPITQTEIIASVRESLRGMYTIPQIPMHELGDSKLDVESPKTHLSEISPDQTATFNGRSIFGRNEADCTGIPQIDSVVGAPKSSHGLKSADLHDLIQPSERLSPEKLCLKEIRDDLQDVSPRTQKIVPFFDRELLLKDKTSAASEDTNEPPSILPILPVDSSFKTSTTKREESVGSAHHKSFPSTTEVSSKEIAKHIISTTAKISDNYHLSQSQSRRLLDTSESDADNVSHYSWDANQLEFWDVIDKGQNVTTKTTPLHSGVMPGPPCTEATSDCSTCGVSFLTDGISRKPSISSDLRSNAKVGEDETIRVFHPPTGYHGRFTSQHASMGDALNNLYHNYTEYSSYCLFDRATRTLFPQLSRGYLDTERPPKCEEGLEVVGLQPQSWAAHQVLERIPAAEYRIAASSSASQYAPSVCVPEISTSRRRSLASEGSEGKLEEMDSRCETPVGSATARLYLGSSYSSTESVSSSNVIDFASLDPTNSVWYEIDDITSKSTKPLKTWADLGKEFLDKHAPDSDSSPEQRTEIALQEALRSRGAAVAYRDDGERITPGDGLSKSHDNKDIEHRKMSHDTGSSDDVTFNYIEDITESESTRAEPKVMPTKLSGQVDFSHPSRLNTTTNDSSLSKASLGAILTSCFEDLSAKDRTNPGPGYINPMCPVKMYRNASYKAEQYLTKSQVPDATVQGSSCVTENDELPSAGDVGINTPSPETFPQTRDEGRAMGAEASGTGLKPTNNPEPEDHHQASAMASTQTMAELSVTTNSNSKTGREEGAGNKFEHDVELILAKRLGNSGVIDAITGDTSTSRSGVEVTPTGAEAAQCRPKRDNCPETWVAPFSPVLRLSTPPSRSRTSAYSPIIPSPLSGQKRVLTPGKRVLTPLSTLYQPRIFEVQIPAPPPNEAETDVSYGFGQELQKCSHAGEDVRENGDRRHMNFMLYGHQIHYNGLKDTMSG